MSTASREGVEEPDGGRARQLDVVAHAAARVEQQADVGLDGAVFLVAAREVGDRLRAAVLDHLEVGLRQIRNRRAGPVADRDADGDQVGFGAKYRLLAPPAPRSRRFGDAAGRAPRAPIRATTPRPKRGRRHCRARMADPTTPAHWDGGTGAYNRRVFPMRRVSLRGAGTMRCLAVCQTELAIRMLDEILLPSFEVDFIVETQAARPAAPRQRAERHGRRPAAHRHLPQGRPHSRHLRRRRGRRPPQPQEDPRSHLQRRRHAGLRARRRRPAHPQARGRAEGAVPRAELHRALGALRRPAAHRVQPLADPAQGAAVPALLQRRRSRADPAAQRSGPRRDGQRPGAAHRAAAHQADGGHRRHPRRDAAREPADGEPARHPHRADHPGGGQQLRPRGDGGRAAALLLPARSTAWTW